VNYNTTVSFASTASTFIPTLDDLNAIIQSAFTGSNNATYLAVIQTSLDTTNIFSTTTSFAFEIPTVAIRDADMEDYSSTSSLNTKKTGIAFGATAGSILFLITGFLAMKYRQTRKLRKGLTFDVDRMLSKKSYITRIDEDYTTVGGESRTVGTSECGDTRSERAYSRMNPISRYDSESLQAPWKSIILDEIDDQEINTSSSYIENKSNNDQISMLRTSISWVSPKSESDNKYDSSLEGNEADDRTADSSLEQTCSDDDCDENISFKR
jgi:hypothetical protein